MILKKKRPQIVTSNGEIINLKRKNGVFILTMWVKIPDEKKGVRDDQMEMNTVQGFTGQDSR